MVQKRHLLGGALLVAGTSIGGGMLALPVMTSLGGFIPSIVIYILCWLFMAGTGLLLLEVSCWLPKDANLVSMAEHTLGPIGKLFAWGLYLFLFYCLTLAYIVGCADLFSELFKETLPEWLCAILFVLFMAPLIFLGARVVGKLNIWMMAGLGISYFAFVILGFPHVDRGLLRHANWTLSLVALPVSFTAFAYQGIVPTLVNYLHRDIDAARKAIIIGSFIPFIAYVVWQWLILGIVPVEGPDGLFEALKNGQNAIYPLKNFLQSSWVYAVGQCFAFFALVTSFFGVTLGLMDFLADGLKLKKEPWNKFWLCLAIFIPPLFIALTHPHVFLIALNYAGGYGCAILLGLLPILMVWAGRYHMGLQSTYRFPGGKIILIIMILFVMFEIFCEIAISIGKLTH